MPTEWNSTLYPLSSGGGRPPEPFVDRAAVRRRRAAMAVALALLDEDELI